MNNIELKAAAKQKTIKPWEYVSDYSKHNEVNKYLQNIIGRKFLEYRKRWSQASNIKKIYDFPLFLVFETLFRCNLKCVMCIHSSVDKKKYSYDGKLPYTVFKDIMKEASKHYCPSMTFGGTSEPLLDQDIVNMVSLAKDSGFIDVMINTNATMLNEDMSRRLIKSGLTRLRIGFDGLTERTYEKIRVGADFKKVRNNIINFVKIRDSMGLKLPIVRVSCVNLSENSHELDGFIKFWKPIVDYVSIQIYRPPVFTKERLKMGPRLMSLSKVVCCQPFERLYIRGNGDVFACCAVAYGPKIGNVSNSTLYDLWNSKKMNRFRNILIKGKMDMLPQLCQKCLVINRGV